MRPADDERQYRLPDPPSFGRSIRLALSDFYFNSWRLVPANLLWGVALIAILLLTQVSPLAAPFLTILLAVPGVGVFRLATLIARDEPVSFSDAVRAWRRYFGRAVLVGAVLVVITFVLTMNIVIGIASADPILWSIATLAGWGLLATWVVAVPFWALLTDPVRESESLRTRLRVAGLLVLIAPLRFGFLFLLMLAVLVVSTVVFAALVTISVAFIALVAVRYTLPAADRLEQRETQPLPG